MIFRYLLLSLLSFNLFAGLEDIKVKNVDPDMKNTFIIWINGDSDRYRPLTNHGSDIVRLDQLDYKKINEYALKCKCNIAILLDQRGNSGFLRSRNNFGVKIKFYSNGKNLSIKNKLRWKKEIKLKEIDLTKSKTLTGFLRLVKRSFQNTSYHLIYRGHSFNGRDNQVQSHFDYSNINNSYGIKKLITSFKNSDIKFKTISFAACSMADINIALELIPFSKKMIATQINVPETGLTGFNFSFLKGISNESKNIDKSIAQSLLMNFKTVEDKNLFLRETPISLIYLDRLLKYKEEIKKSLSVISQNDLDEYYVYTYPSDRYLKYRKARGASEDLLNRIKRLMKVKTLLGDFDFFMSLSGSGYGDLKEKLKSTIKLYDSPSFSPKGGLSFYPKSIE